MEMFVVIGFMFTGMLIGYLLRNRNITWINKIITILIWSLLFLLGVDVGNNKEIINGLHTIGIESLIITIGAILGSIIGAQLLWKWIRKDSNTTQDER